MLPRDYAPVRRLQVLDRLEPRPRTRLPRHRVLESRPVPVRLAGRVHLELADGEAADRTAQLDRDVPVLRDRELDPEMPAGYADELPA